METLLLLVSIFGFDYDLENKILRSQTKKDKIYYQVIYHEVKYNQDYVKLFRFQESNEKVNYHGERVSFVVSEEKLLGFARFSAEDHISAQNELPSVEQSQEIALDFIKKIASDLESNMKILWIKPHDEYINIEKKDIRITGMKVKCKDLSTGLYFWVIIGKDKRIIAFERNIKWIVFPGKRGTEKWLDDNWLLANNTFLNTVNSDTNQSNNKQ